MSLLAVLGFPEFIALIVILGIYTKQMYSGTEEWD